MSLNTILATTPLTSTGYHLKATGTTIGNSLIWDNGTNVGIGNTNTSYTLDVSGTIRATGSIYGDVGFRTKSLNGYQLKNDADSANLGGLVRRSYWAGGAALDTQIFAETGYGIYLNVNGSVTSGMTISSAGNVGIGVTTPTYPLHIGNNYINAGSISSGGDLYGSAYFGQTGLIVGIQSTTSNTALFTYGTNKDILFGCWNGSSNSEKMRIASTGYITTTSTADGIRATLTGSSGTAFVSYLPSTAFYSAYFLVGGNTAGYIDHPTSSTTRYYTGPSDERLKSNIKNWDENVLDLFKDINPKTYTHNADNDESIVYKGFIAQEMVDKFPEAYGIDKDGYYGFNPSGFIPYLVKAIQEMNTKLDAQNQTIQNLQEQINILAK